MRAAVVVGLAMLLLTQTLIAQRKVDFLAAAAEAEAAQAADRQPVVGSPARDAVSAALSADLARARLDYDKFAFSHAERTFTWQYWSGILVFLVVMAAVVIGLWLSYLHFYQGRRGGGLLKMSTSGIEMSSPVIGLMILTISLGFFYLYLSQVYPITEVKP